MLTTLIVVLIAALVAYVIWRIIGLFIPDGTIRMVIGFILGLVLLVFALQKFGISLG